MITTDNYSRKGEQGHILKMNYGTPTEVTKNIPYTVSYDDIIYADGTHTIVVEKWKVEYYADIIKESLSNPEEYAQDYFSLIMQMLDNPALWDGIQKDTEMHIRKSMVEPFNFADYIHSDKKVTPSIFVYHSDKRDGNYEFRQFEIGNNGMLEALKEVLAYMDFKEQANGKAYEWFSSAQQGREELVEQMQKCAHKLLEMGLEREDIIENLFESRRLREVYVSADGKIYLLEKMPGKISLARHIPVKLPPLDRAIYILFLRHPEGINFKDLPDYRKELTQIYHKLMNYRTSASMQKSIEDVTDPTKNSINEKCARIRHAFATHMGNFMAHNYAITGNRGETKRILLDREYIRFDWEAMPLANGQESQT
jgi:hypothetical protein